MANLYKTNYPFSEKNLTSKRFFSYWEMLLPWLENCFIKRLFKTKLKYENLLKCANWTKKRKYFYLYVFPKNMRGEIRFENGYVCYVFKRSQLFCYHSRSNLAPLDTGKLSVSKSLLMNSFTFLSIFGSFMSWGQRKVVTLKETILIMVKTMEPVTRSKPSNALN